MKKANNPTEAAVQWNPSSEKASGWLVSLFFVQALNKGGSVKKPAFVIYNILVTVSFFIILYHHPFCYSFPTGQELTLPLLFHIDKTDTSLTTIIINYNIMDSNSVSSSLLLQLSHWTGADVAFIVPVERQERESLTLQVNGDAFFHNIDTLFTFFMIIVFENTKPNVRVLHFR